MGTALHALTGGIVAAYGPVHEHLGAAAIIAAGLVARLVWRRQAR